MANELTGGCLCGALRYRARNIIRAGYCHCRMCQKASGAPVVAWLMVHAHDYEVTKGKVAAYRSSPHADREFCSRCGSQLAFRPRDGSGEIDINLATLDHPEAVAPQYHIYTISKLPWLHIEDQLPQYLQERESDKT